MKNWVYVHVYLIHCIQSRKCVIFTLEQQQMHPRNIEWLMIVLTGNYEILRSLKCSTLLSTTVKKSWRKKLLNSSI